MDGFINLLKPLGPSSFQMVREVKKILGEKRIGHTGTLDPGAAGVLPLCVGRATKIAGFVTGFQKLYRAEITFGIETDTQDIYGNVISTNKVDLTEKDLQTLLGGFKGVIEQVPPMYSAVKVGGQKLYELARRGKTVERAPRKVSIYELKLVEFMPPDKAILDIRCSKGTYIRTLCRDIGIKSGFGAVMSYLVRVSSGSFHMNSAVTIEELEESVKKGRVEELVLPLDYPLKDINKAEVNERSLKYALNGNKLFAHNMVTPLEGFNNGQQLRIYSGERFIGMGRVIAQNGKRYIKMDRVI